VLEGCSDWLLVGDGDGGGKRRWRCVICAVLQWGSSTKLLVGDGRCVWLVMLEGGREKRRSEAESHSYFISAVRPRHQQFKGVNSAAAKCAKCRASMRRDSQTMNAGELTAPVHLGPSYEAVQRRRMLPLHCSRFSFSLSPSFLSPSFLSAGFHP
jgi:hypothetical protein